MDYQKVLVLSPHPDDGELSAGGSIVRAIENGSDVYYVSFSACEKSLPGNCNSDILKKECKSATKELGIPGENVQILGFEVRNFFQVRQQILDELIVLEKEFHPDLVITPSSFDTHQDHNVIYQEGIRAFKKTASIIGMEHPWNNLDFRTDIFISLSEEQLKSKIRALKRYSSQSQRDYFKEDYIRACALTRGMNVGSLYAEVFECIRMRF